MAVSLHHGDCLDVLPTLSAGSVDAVICDLPYGTTACAWDTVISFAPMWEQIKRLVKSRAAVVLFGSQPFTSALVMSNAGWFKYCWVWEKNTPVDVFNCKNKPLRKHEDITVFSGGTVANRSPNLMTYNPQGLRSLMIRRINNSVGGDVYGSRPSRANRTQYIQESTGYPHSVLKFAEPTDNLHPTQKPVDLLRYLVRTYTNAGDTVLDFTMGSGTTGVAAILEGRNFVGVELDTGYFDIASRRIADTERTMRGEFKPLADARLYDDMPIFSEGNR